MVSVISDKRRLENGDCSLVPKYKRRKVSAVRDFPPGCGPNAERVDTLTKEMVNGGRKLSDFPKDVEFSQEKGGDVHDEEGKGLSKNNVESESRDIPVGSDSPPGKATPNLVKCIENGTEELPKLPVDLGSSGLSKALILVNAKSSEEDSQKMEDELMSKDEIHDTSKGLIGMSVESPSALKNTGVLDLKGAGNDTKSEKVTEGSSAQMCLSPHYSVPSPIKERKYPPRRRVSAVRDFPVGCGRNALLLNEAQDAHLGRDKTEVSTHKEIARNDVNQIEGGSAAVNASGNETKGVDGGKGGDDIECQTESGNGVSAEMIMQVSQVRKSSETKRQKEISEDKDDEQHGKEMEKVGYSGKSDRDIGDSGDAVDKELVVYTKDKLKKKKSTGLQCSNVDLQEDSGAGVGNETDMVFVQGLMSGPRRRAKSIPSITSVKRNKRKKPSPDKNKDKETMGGSSRMMIPYSEETEISEASREPDILEEGDSSENEEPCNDFQLVPRSRDCDVNLPPFGAGSSSDRGVRSKVRETLRLFQVVVRKLLQEEETKSKDQDTNKRIDLSAGSILKKHGKYYTGPKFVGPVPGVEVGDEFHYRVELAVIGLHGPLQSGIETTKQGKITIATSIVASGGYANDVDSSDVLIYTGQGGKASGGDKQAEDQKLERGNLALKNSIDVKNYVRVIRGFKETTKAAEAGEKRPKVLATYTYDGLYTVEKYWPDLGPHGKLVYKFELRRIPGQPELAWKEVKKSKKFKVREGRCVADISGGKEAFAICAVNTIDDEKPPSFTYITSMMYPDWCQPIPPRGCDCKGGCSDSERCVCAVKNGGEIPYNYNGAIVQAKSLVYECGPCCKCPPSCHNRVSQNGIKLPLEIFKTESRGWGVRSLSSISSGSFICEYIGELLDDKEAEQRAGSDEYLFDIGQNYNDTSLWGDLSTLMPDMLSSSSDVVENVGFTIDAAEYGNIGRFINHSCTPNLYAQNVLYDHEDKRIPHIMLFAAENIPPLQELTYHYNYTIDEVFDSDGNIKKKSCYCGSSECTGRMY